MSVIGVIGVCFAVMLPNNEVNLMTQRCYTEPPAKYETMRSCKESTVLALRFVGRAMLRIRHNQYVAEKKIDTNKTRVAYRFTATCTPVK